MIRHEFDPRRDGDAVVERDGGAGTDDVSPTAAAESYGSRERLRRIATRIENRGGPLTVDALTERAFEAFLRERHQLVVRKSRDRTLEAIRSELLN
ncbi:hypothetical protein [Halorubrum aethiopicum]|uniref:hypothetical protein n=1 Tax=Halorubrum aethiopicum TaxID=1758255 RepID=UPI000AA3587A|nr:hypothetical protein [Halorubrum aethiopicum]